MNIQDECQKIHAQYGVSDMANYQIQLLFEKSISDHEQAIGLTHPNMKILLRRGVKSPDSCGLDDTYGVFELYEYVSKLPTSYKPKTE